MPTTGLALLKSIGTLTTSWFTNFVALIDKRLCADADMEAHIMATAISNTLEILFAIIFFISQSV